MRRLLREPLLHFLALGAALFALYAWLNGNRSAPNEIVVPRGQLENLQAQFQRTWQRPPTTDELEGLVDGWVREEILYREGLALGLDRDDAVVRRRISQKVEFLADGQTPSVPTQDELEYWLRQHPADYRIESTYSFRQIYFDPARHREGIDADVADVRAQLARGKVLEGDPTLLPGSLENVTSSEVARVFGNEFANALAGLSTKSWQGPVRSSFGVHFVELTTRQQGRDATLAEVRDAVERDLIRARAELANKAFYEKLRGAYTVRIEQDPERAGSGAAK